MKTNKTRGSMLVVFLFLSLAVGIFLSGVAKWGGETLYLRRRQIALQNVLMTVLRTQSDSLERLAVQAGGLEHWVQRADATGVTVPAANSVVFSKAAADLKSSLSGYKGRITAVRKVISDANGLDADAVTVIWPLNPPIALSPQGQWVSDENGHRSWVDSLWLQRLWDSARADSQGHPLVTAVYHLPNSLIGPLDLHSSGRVVWEGRSDIISPSPDGGFPRFWNECYPNAAFHPYRQAYYSVRAAQAQEAQE